MPFVVVYDESGIRADVDLEPERSQPHQRVVTSEELEVLKILVCHYHTLQRMLRQISDRPETKRLSEPWIKELTKL